MKIPRMPAEIPDRLAGIEREIFRHAALHRGRGAGKKQAGNRKGQLPGRDRDRNGAARQAEAVEYASDISA
jgi:hypothetical protein